MLLPHKVRTMDNQILFVHICDRQLADKLRTKFTQGQDLFGQPKIKIFHGPEWDITPGPNYNGEKLDYIFLRAEELEDRPGVKLPDVLDKYGKSDTKIIVFKCPTCPKCGNAVRELHGNLITEFTEYPHLKTNDFIEKYFSQALAH